MKRFILIPSLLCAGLLMAACSSDEEKIKESAQGYLNALGNYRPAEARPYASAETCEKTLAFYEALMKYTDSSVFKNNIPATIALGEIDYSDDTSATVAFHKSTPITEQDGTLRTEIPWQQAFSATLHMMLAAVTRYAVGLAYQPEGGSGPEEELTLLRDMMVKQYSCVA